MQSLLVVFFTRRKESRREFRLVWRVWIALRFQTERIVLVESPTAGRTIEEVPGVELETW